MDPMPVSYFIRSGFDNNLVVTYNDTPDRQVILAPLNRADWRQRWVAQPHGQSAVAFACRRKPAPGDQYDRKYLTAFGRNQAIGLTWEMDSGSLWIARAVGTYFEQFTTNEYGGQALNTVDPPTSPAPRIGNFAGRDGDTTAKWVLETALRPRLTALPPEQRSDIVAAILNFLNDAVIAAHPAAGPSGDLLQLARTYTPELDAYVWQKTGWPVPMWDPSEDIPAEFMVVKPMDSGAPRPALVSSQPNLPQPWELAEPHLATRNGLPDLATIAQPWDLDMRQAVGGVLSDDAQAAAAPIFWCWYAWLNELVEEYNTAARSKPPLNWNFDKMFCLSESDGRALRQLRQSDRADPDIPLRPV